jgi:hypothetical protein
MEHLGVLGDRTPTKFSQYHRREPAADDLSIKYQLSRKDSIYERLQV